MREADYSRPETLATAFQGASKLLLISGNELGRRDGQHKAVIDAANAAGITFIAYTSLLHCDTSPLALAKEHLATEQYLVSSGLGTPCCATGGTSKIKRQPFSHRSRMGLSSVRLVRVGLLPPRVPTMPRRRPRS